MDTRLNFYSANPEAMRLLGALEQRIAKSAIEKPLAELLRLRVSQIKGCAYCLDVHFSDAIKAGEQTRRLATLSAWRETPFFSDRERAALAWTEAVTLVADTRVPDAVWEGIRPHFTPEELVDLMLLITTINTWNRFAIAFRKMPT